MIDLSRENILEIYYLVEKLVEIFHDDERAHNRETINRFIADYYPSIHKLYYETIWNALTIEERQAILGADYTDDRGRDYALGGKLLSERKN